NIEKNDASLIEEVLARRGGENTPMLRLAFVPERKDEVFDILEFDAPAFRRSIFQLAHHDDVRVLDFEQAKEVNVEDRELVIHQQKRGNSTGIDSTIRVRENGAIVIDQTLSARTQDRQHFGFDMQI